MATKKVAKKPAAKNTTKPAAKKVTKPAVKKVSRPAAKPAVKKVSRPAAKPVAKKAEFKNSEVSIVVAMAVEAVILLIGYLIIMHYVG